MELENKVSLVPWERSVRVVRLGDVHVRKAFVYLRWVHLTIDCAPCCRLKQQLEKRCPLRSLEVLIFIAGEANVAVSLSRIDFHLF